MAVGQLRSERTKVMMKNFVTDFENGLSIQQIAYKYGLNRITVYRNLQEIAETNGYTSREHFLKIIRTNVPDLTWQRRHEETQKSLAELKRDISKTNEHTKNLLSEINSLIKNMEE